MNIYEQQTKNKRLTVVIMLGFIAFFLFLGIGFDYFYASFQPQKQVEFVDYGDGYYEGEVSNQPIPYFTIIALIVACFMIINSANNGAGMVLRSTMARRARSSDPNEQQFLNIVSEMSIASGLPKPHAYIVPDMDLNAFATGFSPEKSYIAVTQGLVAKLNREELQAVVAHEMSHIRNYDIRLMTIVSALMGAIVLLRDFTARRMFWGRGRSRSSSNSSGGGPIMIAIFVIWIIAMIFAPFFTRLLAMAISRKREYLADASAAELTRNPKGLISALEKIRNAVMPTKKINNGVAHMCITDPRGSLIEEKLGFTADLLASHPPMEKRILALKVMSYQQ
ncbi:MAG: M48 family metallopeptidase [Elusimicrobiales bacterium]|nr:M48 family metallopeptidase [Elusimicrobiales bacterium]